MSESRSIVLSRYFDGNVQFIARSSTEIYEESDVKIVGINLALLKRYDKTLTDEISSSTDHGINKRPTEDVKPSNTSPAKNQDLQKLNAGGSFDWKVEEATEPEEKRGPFWVPPRSPHNLIEELLYEDPWALLVATVFLNRTNCALAKPRLFDFLLDHRGPSEVLDKLPRDLEGYFVGLGLQRTRAVQVYRMSYDYAFKEWSDVEELYGIGHYGGCAFRMFCLGDFSMQPRDRYLRIYKGWYEKVYSRV